MAQNDPDERLVYLACQHIFRGSNSHVRKLKAVKGLIEQNRLALSDILREHDIDRTSTVAKKLLENRVFNSTLRARTRFPELFDVSPTQSAEREASEAEAARDEANTVQEISEREAPEEIEIVSYAAFNDERTPSTDRFTSTALLKNNLGTIATVPSLYPVYIQYRGQHFLLTTIQGLLEESCFKFAQQQFPHVLATNGWDCPEAGELTEWTKILAQHPAAMVKDLKRPLHEVLGLLRELRHSAVHRLRKTAAGVERLAENAQLFLEALDDPVRSEKVACIRRELRSSTEELKRNKNLLEGRLLAQLREIQTRRIELEAWEKSAKETMMSENLQCSNDIAEGLQRCVQAIRADEPAGVQGENTLLDEYSDSLDSEDEVLEPVVAAPQSHGLVNSLVEAIAVRWRSNFFVVAS
ncbi:uncharacterized protein N7482_004612 [Penicillium canariense]|uniref:Ubiquinol-cytochrome-c reductase cytochrome c1 n=1 Tax=Penicillium canariense TaxID=189055 RepID=A0A9W9I916_9EURO|nr:uncharacterized protein N7482_004612 [Penicillium canariense]KAJ5169018.1 hypothetical protein N7482_004612 [Penicillium canariense]